MAMLNWTTLFGATMASRFWTSTSTRLAGTCGTSKAFVEPLEEGVDVESPHIIAFLEAYRQEYVLTDESLALLPDFSSLSHMNSYASLHRTVDTSAEQALSNGCANSSTAESKSCARS